MLLRPGATAGTPGRLQRAAAGAWRPVLFMGGLLVFWQVVVTVRDVNPIILPAPTRIAEAMWTSRSVLFTHTWVTVQTAVLGTTVALVVAMVFGIMIDAIPWVRRSVYPVIVVSQTMPIVAIAPLVVIWFGFGMESHIFVVALYTFFAITVGLVQGLASTDQDMMNLLRTMRAGRAQVLWRVRFPSALPQLFTGIKVSITYAMVAAVIAQFVGAIHGLGIFMLTMKNALRTDLVFGAVVVTAAVTLLLFGIVSVVERLVMPWYRPTGRER